MIKTNAQARHQPATQNIYYVPFSRLYHPHKAQRLHIYLKTKTWKKVRTWRRLRYVQIEHNKKLFNKRVRCKENS